MVAAEVSVSLTPIIIALVSAGGLAGAIVALLKLKPEANSMAVVQAQGSMEIMAKLNEELEDAFNREHKRLIELRLECERLTEELRECRQMVRHLSTAHEQD